MASAAALLDAWIEELEAMVGTVPKPAPRAAAAASPKPPPAPPSAADGGGGADAAAAPPQHRNTEKKEKKKKAAPPPAPAAATGGEAPLVTQLEFKVGRIVKVWHHEDADKLFCEVCAHRHDYDTRPMRIR